MQYIHIRRINALVLRIAFNRDMRNALIRMNFNEQTINIFEQASKFTNYDTKDFQLDRIFLPAYKGVYRYYYKNNSDFQNNKIKGVIDSKIYDFCKKNIEFQFISGFIST